MFSCHNTKISRQGRARGRVVERNITTSNLQGSVVVGKRQGFQPRAARPQQCGVISWLGSLSPSTPQLAKFSTPSRTLNPSMPTKMKAWQKQKWWFGKAFDEPRILVSSLPSVFCLPVLLLSSSRKPCPATPTYAQGSMPVAILARA